MLSLLVDTSMTELSKYNTSIASREVIHIIATRILYTNTISIRRAS